MKKILPGLLLLLIVFCIVYSTTAQTHKFYSVFGKEEVKLASNRTAFIFTNSNKYSNPAISLFNARKNIITLNTIPADASVESSLIKPEAITQEDVCMYTNVTEDELWIKLNSELKITKEVNVEIYNNTGERVYNSIFNENLHKINLCNLTAGTFLVRLDETVQKLVIE